MVEIRPDLVPLLNIPLDVYKLSKSTIHKIYDLTPKYSGYAIELGGNSSSVYITNEEESEQ